VPGARGDVGMAIPILAEQLDQVLDRLGTSTRVAPEVPKVREVGLLVAK